MIAHVDADSFFASVLIRKDPRLRGKPLLALGMGGGCVIAASYEAKDRGVKTGMLLADALKLVPDAIRLPSDFHEAGLASEQIESILRETCPRVEQMSVDEWYLDIARLVGGVPRDPQTWARQLQISIRERTGLTVSFGVGPSKLLAKMAGEYRKPAGVSVVHTDPSRFPQALGIEEFLRDRPAPAIPGIGRKRNLHAETEGWRTAWDIAQAPTERLIAHFGRPGSDLQRELLGERLSEVRESVAPPKSVSRARSFRRENDPRKLWGHVLRHAEYTVLKMRRHRLSCKGVSVWLRDDGFGYESTHASLPQPGCTEDSLLPYVRRCLRKLYQPRKRYTQVGLALWNLQPQGAVQFSLFDEPDRTCRSEDVQRTLDDLHEKFGRNSITRGAALDVKTGTRRKMEIPTYEMGEKI
jgi:DNA polymerase-4